MDVDKTKEVKRNGLAHHITAQLYAILLIAVNHIGPF
jgi:hypothetical protein